jgi:hypothetical protein
MPGKKELLSTRIIPVYDECITIGDSVYVIFSIYLVEIENIVPTVIVSVRTRRDS